jgi:hypothetical protein
MSQKVSPSAATRPPRRQVALIFAIGLVVSGSWMPVTRAGQAAVPAVSQASWTAQSLDRLLAPIALYPD